MPFAAASTGGASRAGSTRVLCTTMPTAASAVPSPSSTGAATEHEPSVISSQVTAYPRRRTVPISRRSRPGSTMLYAVGRASGRRRYSRRKPGSENASNALPTPVACSGSRLPVREMIGTDLCPESRST